MDIYKIFSKMACATPLVFAIVGNLNAQNSEIFLGGLENGLGVFGQTFQNEQILTATTLARTATGSPFLIDFFEPYLQFDAALEALNKTISEFNANYPASLVHLKSDEDGTFTPVFSAIEKDERVPLFKVIKVMRDYANPKYPHETTSILKDIYEEVSKEGDFVVNDLMAALDNIRSQVGYGWHLKDNIYREGISETKGGVITYADDCTIKVEEELNAVSRSYFLTEDIRLITAAATVVQNMVAPLLSSEKEAVKDVFVPVEEGDPERVNLFHYMGSTYKLREGVYLNIVNSLNSNGSSTAVQIEHVQTTLSALLVKIQRIYRFAQ